MKLALVTETYPPEVNGVAMTLARLVGGLSARGHHVEVVRPRQRAEVSAGAKPVTGSDPRVTAFLVPGVPIPFYRSLRIGLPVRSSLRRRWQASRPDVVHVATEGPLGYVALRAATELGIPVTSSFHTNFHSYGGHYGFNLLRGWTLRYLRWFHNRTRCTLVPTDEGVAQLAAQGFERLGVLARGVDTQLFSPARRSEVLRSQWGAGPADTVVLYVGRVAPEKNLQLAVTAFLELKAREPRARFVLVGDGPARAPLAKQNPDFIWAGVRRGEDLATHYASADVFVFPSVTETFGNVITEAMASGLVVLSYDYAAARQHLRSGVNGFAAPLHDEGAFCAVARTLPDERAAWPAIRERARTTTLGITWDSIVEAFERRLLDQQPAATAAARTG